MGPTPEAQACLAVRCSTVLHWESPALGVLQQQQFVGRIILLGGSLGCPGLGYQPCVVLLCLPFIAPDTRALFSGGGWPVSNASIAQIPVYRFASLTETPEQRGHVTLSVQLQVNPTF